MSVGRGGFGFCLLLTLLSSSRPFLISRRHSIHLAVNTADTPEFRLSNFARVARGQMAAARAGARGISVLPNPFTIDQNCDPNAEFRRINGTCNNLQQPFRGAAKIPLERLQNNTYEDGVESPTRTFFRSAGDLPSARMVSLVVHETTSNLSNRNSHLLMNFGQFTDHDVTLSPEANAEGGEEESPKEICCEPNSARARAFSTVEFSECFNIPTPNDPFLNDSCMPFIRSAISPRLPGAPEVRFQLNDLTAFVDASQVYGVTLNRANSLREFRGGLLRISRGLNNEERLPPRRDNPPDCFTISNMECRFAAGDSRTSEQAGLTSVHTLFLREHNKIVRELVKLNPTWSDERLYQTARKIVGAIMQRLVYGEYLPEVLGPNFMNKYDLTLARYQRFTGYSPNIDPAMVTEFSTAAFRFGHSTIRQTFGINGVQLDLKRIFDSFITVDRFGNNALLAGLSSDDMEQRDRFFSRGIRDDLLGIMLDLPAFNIQRGRDHGIPSYNSIRRFFRLPVYRTYAEMEGRTHTGETIAKLKMVYPTPDDIEMFPGGVSELPVPHGVVGETFANIIGEQFRRLKFGDRFWHETDNLVTGFTNAQLAELRKITFATLYCRNLQERFRPEIRRRMLVANIPGNEPVSCNSLPQVNLDPWRERKNIYPTRSPYGY